MINALFKNIIEIRMGSPFHFSDVALSGEWVPVLQTQGVYQDLATYSDDKSKLALIQWDLEGAEREYSTNLAFRILIIDANKQTVLQSNLVKGACKEIQSVSDKSVKISIWMIDDSTKREKQSEITITSFHCI